MKRSQLEHIIRAASSITGDREIVILGSQAILGQFPDAPEGLLRSVEADVFPKNIHEILNFRSARMAFCCGAFPSMTVPKQ